jgi:hypothetical protein
MFSDVGIGPRISSRALSLVSSVPQGTTRRSLTCPADKHDGGF